MTLSDIVIDYRNSHSLSQRQFAQSCGLSNGFISMIESGKNPATGKKIVPSLPKLKALAQGMSMTLDELLTVADDLPVEILSEKTEIVSITAVRIPVLGYIRAGIPIEAVEEILDYEEISPALARTGEFFALKIKGDSMEPKISDGDVVIVRKQETVENGDIGVILINGGDATVKKVYVSENGVKLISTNQQYDPFFYTPKEVEELPLRIIGKVVELRAKF